MTTGTSSEILSGAAYLRSAARETAREWRAMTAREGLAGNIAAGVTVTLVALPLNVALAIAAGLPPSAGLVSGAVAGAIGALLGGSRFQITGPEVALAPITLEIASRHGLSGLAVATFLAGLIQLLLGTLRLGSLVHAIPLPVVGGFLAAVGLLVFNTQLPRLLGLPAEVASIAHFDFGRDLTRLSLPAVCVGLGVIAILVVLPRVHRRLPAPLFALLVGVAAVALLKLPLATVTPLEVSLPRPSLPLFGQVDWLALMPEALALALLASIDSLLCAVSIDTMVGGERTRTDQELAAQGFANLASACFGGMPVAAAVVRSVAAYEAGATTRLAALTQSALLFGLLFLAPLLGNVPLVALAAILLVVGYRLIQWRALLGMWSMARSEGLIFIGTALGILMTDFVLGVALGVIAALARFAQQQRASLLTRATRDLTPDSGSVREVSGLRMLRVEGPLFFASQRSIEDAVGALHQSAHVVVDLSAVSTVDLSGATALANALRKLASSGVRVRVTTFGAELDPLLNWAFQQHAPNHVLPLEQRAEQALRSLADGETITADMNHRISAA